MRASSGQLEVMQLTFVCAWSMPAAQRAVVKSAIPMPHALPWVAAVRPRTTILVMRGRAGFSPPPQNEHRPMTLVSMPVPLTSLPSRSISSTSSSSNGSLGRSS